MKKILGIACAVAMAAPLAFGQASVFSQNAVGYVRVKVPAQGELNLVRQDFLPLDPSVPPNMLNLVGDQLPTGSNAFIWDSTANEGLGGYIFEQKSARGGWGNGTEIAPGQAFWLQTPAADPNDYFVYLMGEVPGANNDSEEVTIAGVAGFDAVGYGFPAAIAFGDTDLAEKLPTNSNVFFWNVETQGYQFFQKQARGGWPNDALDFVIEPGTSFWVENVGAPIDWVESKPYAWP